MRPTGIDAAFLTRTLEQKRVEPGALVVDAGCGTGAHARQLAALGYRVIGVDASAELVEEARRLSSHEIEYAVADLRDWSPHEPAAAVLCRGVLNDVLTEREAALRSLGGMLAPAGLLVADARDWERSAERYAGGRVLERHAQTSRGDLVLHSETRAEPERRELVVDERIVVDGVEHRHEVRMRPWSRDELEAALRAAGFAQVELVDPARAGAREDRIVVVARLSASVRA